MGLFDIFKQKNWLQVPLDENHNTWDARHSFLLNYSETTSNEDDSQVLSIYQEMIQFFKERKYSSELQDKYSSLQFLWHRPDHYKMRNLIKSKNPKLYFDLINYHSKKLSKDSNTGVFLKFLGERESNNDFYSGWIPYSFAIYCREKHKTEKYPYNTFVYNSIIHELKSYLLGNDRYTERTFNKESFRPFFCNFTDNELRKDLWADICLSIKSGNFDGVDLNQNKIPLLIEALTQEIYTLEYEKDISNEDKKYMIDYYIFEISNKNLNKAGVHETIIWIKDKL